MRRLCRSENSARLARGMLGDACGPRFLVAASILHGALTRWLRLARRACLVQPSAQRDGVRGEPAPPTALSGAAVSRNDHRRSAASGSRFPQLADRYAEQADEGRSPSGSAAASAGTWPSPPALPAPTSWTSTTMVPPEAATPPSPGSSARAWPAARRPTCRPRGMWNAQHRARTGTACSASWPGGSPASPRGTATRPCSGPPTVPWTPTPPST